MASSTATGKAATSQAGMFLSKASDLAAELTSLVFTDGFHSIGMIEACCVSGILNEKTQNPNFSSWGRFLHIFATKQIRRYQGKKTFVRFINHAVTHPSQENTRRIKFHCTYSINSLVCGQSLQIKLADLEKTQPGDQDKTSKKISHMKNMGCVAYEVKMGLFRKTYRDLQCSNCKENA